MLIHLMKYAAAFGWVTAIIYDSTESCRRRRGSLSLRLDLTHMNDNSSRR